MQYLRAKWLLWILVPALAVAGGYWLGTGSDSGEVPMPESERALAEAPVPEVPATAQLPQAPRLMATASGAVCSPGAYALEQDARVQDLIDAAGGLRTDAVLDDINIAAHVIDGSVLTIPLRPGDAVPVAQSFLLQPAARLNPPAYTRSGWVPPHGGTTAPAAISGGLIDLNSASQVLLETLPGVGPVTAGKIVEYRRLTPFARVDDLTNIHGIGEKTLETLRPLVTVR